MAGRSFDAFVKIRIVCTQVSQLSSHDTLWVDSQFQESVHRILSMHSASNRISISLIVNSSLHFEAEVRHIIKVQAPVMACKLTLPRFHGNECKIQLELFPTTYTSADSMHTGLSNAELVSVAPRSSIDPVCLEGSALSARPARMTAVAAAGGEAVFKSSRRLADNLTQSIHRDK